jgi:hypothetical protein
MEVSSRGLFVSADPVNLSGRIAGTHMSKLSHYLVIVAAIASILSLWLTWTGENKPLAPQLQLFSEFVKVKAAIVAANRHLSYLAGRIKETAPSQRESMTARLSRADETCGNIWAAAEAYVDSLERISRRKVTYDEQQEWQIREGVLRSGYLRCAKEVNEIERLLAANQTA